MSSLTPTPETELRINLVRRLCSLVGELRAYPAYRPPSEETVRRVFAPTLRHSEAEICDLLDAIPVKDHHAVREDLASSLSPELCARLPRGADALPFQVSEKVFGRLITLSPDVFAMLLDHGLEPASHNDSFEDNVACILALCNGPDSKEVCAWRANLAGYLDRASECLTTLLWYIRNHPDMITDDLSVFLASEITRQVTARPDEAEQALHDSVLGSASFEAGALMLAGSPLTEPGPGPVQGGPKVRAIVERCRSHHGRLGFHAAHGPLAPYLRARGASLEDVPDAPA